MKLYIDTCVYMDYFGLNENNYLGKNFIIPAKKLFTLVRKKKLNIVVSSWVLEELNRFVNMDLVSDFFEDFKDLLVSVQYDNNDKQKARELSLENYDDALHVVLAEKSKADIIITRNISHFTKVRKEMDVKLPEEFTNLFS